MMFTMFFKAWTGCMASSKRITTLSLRQLTLWHDHRWFVSPCSVGSLRAHSAQMSVSLVGHFVLPPIFRLHSYSFFSP
jgi:hypothetical protein